ncbi:hypothetical protein RvY_16196 [Ramazzottius varieornatus]|uniref:guanylate cyclase n=1 Tax=Ramazzottius varieornatus TaxID=947166 RepID=A0A1D1W5B7_RAMVA|nr:hypothetical protein RvY_16196 [Ramazzottius varieornatus]
MILTTKTGVWRRRLVTVRHCNKKSIVRHRGVLKEVNFARSLSNEHVLKFLKASITSDRFCILYEAASRGTLYDLIGAKSKLDWIVRFSFLNAIVGGLRYLYSRGLTSHSRLTSQCLYLDAQFVLKVADYGMPSFFNFNQVELWFAKRRPEYNATMIWTAPEVLRDQDGSTGKSVHVYNKSIDIYSFGIILQEVISWGAPYCVQLANGGLTPSEIIRCVHRGHNAEGTLMRPQFDDQLDCDHGMVDLAVRCWAEEQADRMDWNHIKEHLTHTSQIMGFRATGSIVDALLGQVETLTVALSDEISDIQRKIQREHDKYLKTLMLFVPRFVCLNYRPAKIFAALRLTGWRHLSVTHFSA